MPQIHPTAIIDPRSELADDVRIDAYAVLEGRVILGPGTHIKSHSILKGHTVIGANCTIGPAAYVGLDPQFLKFDGSETSLIIGDNVVIREGASVHRSIHANTGDAGVGHATRIGNGCFLMATAHVAHDCVLGNDVVLANTVLLGGHVTIGDRAFLGGGTGVHQFVNIGRIAMIAGAEAISRDVPPFAAVRYGGLKGYNAIGCRRAGISQAAIHAIRQAYFCMHTHRTVPRAVEAIKSQGLESTPEVAEMLAAIARSKRGIQPSVRFLNATRSTDDSE